MIVSIASGKGGTGKTTVAASLTRVWEKPLVAVDLDVEEPNLHLFLHPNIEESATACLEVPVVDESKCTLMRRLLRALSIQGNQRNGHIAPDISGNVPRMRRLHRFVSREGAFSRRTGTGRNKPGASERDTISHGPLASWGSNESALHATG